MAPTVEVALALIQREGRDEWLVTRRSSGRVFAGMWEFPGGKMQEGETPSEGAVREAREETGLSVLPLRVIGCLNDVHDGKTVRLHLVRCHVAAGEPAPADPAVTEVRWVTLAEMRQIEMPPANAAILDLLTVSEGG